MKEKDIRMKRKSKTYVFDIDVLDMMAEIIYIEHKRNDNKGYKKSDIVNDAIRFLYEMRYDND